MTKILIEVIGVEPPCPKCKTTLKIVNEVVDRLGLRDRVEIVKKDINSDEIVNKYGVLISPSLAINGEVKIQGRVPLASEVEKLLKLALEGGRV